MTDKLKEEVSKLLKVSRDTMQMCGLSPRHDLFRRITALLSTLNDTQESGGGCRPKTCHGCTFFDHCHRTGKVGNSYGGLECSALWDSRSSTPKESGGECDCGGTGEIEDKTTGYLWPCGFYSNG